MVKYDVAWTIDTPAQPGIPKIVRGYRTLRTTIRAANKKFSAPYQLWCATRPVPSRWMRIKEAFSVLRQMYPEVMGYSIRGIVTRVRKNTLPADAILAARLREIHHG